MYAVEANQELFDRWKTMGTQIDHCKSIVQNDMDLTDGQIDEWYEHFMCQIADAIELASETVDHARRVKVP